MICERCGVSGGADAYCSDCHRMVCEVCWKKSALKCVSCATRRPEVKTAGKAERRRDKEFVIVRFQLDDVHVKEYGTKQAANSILTELSDGGFGGWTAAETIGNTPPQTCWDCDCKWHEDEECPECECTCEERLNYVE